MGRESVPRSCCGNETECDSWFISMGYILCFVNRDFINLNFVLLLIFFFFFFFRESADRKSTHGVAGNRNRQTVDQ